MSEDEKTNDLRKRWLGRLTRETEAHKDFRTLAKEAYNAYQSEREDRRETFYPVFWANSTITHAAIFSRQPKPDVRARLTDNQPDKQIPLVIERAISYQQDITAFDDHSNRAVREFVVCGLGCTRAFLKTDTATQPVMNPVDGSPVVNEAGEPVTEEIIAGQYVCLEYIAWNRFRWEPNKDWEDVDWIAFDHWLTGAEIKEQFGADVGQGAAGDDGNKTKPKAQKYASQYLVHEIFDRKKREVIFITESVDKVLRITPDPLKLKDFYPCPRPMMMNLRAGELIPTPEYKFIRYLCDDANKLTSRIRNLIDTVRDVGYYDASFGELSEIMGAADGTRVPLNNLLERLDGVASLQNVLVSIDNTPKVAVIASLVQEREGVKAALYELTGISDIVRGASNASETASAQQLKNQWANVRLSEKMREVAMHFRGVFRVYAELIAEHFTPEQIKGQTGIDLSPEQQAVMKSDMGRTYAIDVEADSTIAQDESQEKTDRLEFVKAISEYLSALSDPNSAVPKDLSNALLLFVTRSFRHGRMIEEQLEQLPGTMQQIEGLQQQVQQAQQQLQQMQEQAAQQAEQTQKQLMERDGKIAAFSERKEAREDFKAQSEDQGRKAEAAKDFVQAQTASVPAYQ